MLKGDLDGYDVCDTIVGKVDGPRKELLHNMAKAVGER